MKKKILIYSCAILVLSLLLISFVACDKDETLHSDTNIPNTEIIVELNECEIIAQSLEAKGYNVALDYLDGSSEPIDDENKNININIKEFHLTGVDGNNRVSIIKYFNIDVANQEKEKMQNISSIDLLGLECIELVELVLYYGTQQAVEDARPILAFNRILEEEGYDFNTVSVGGISNRDVDKGVVSTIKNKNNSSISIYEYSDREKAIIEESNLILLNGTLFYTFEKIIRVDNLIIYGVATILDDLMLKI